MPYRGNAPTERLTPNSLPLLPPGGRGPHRTPLREESTALHWLAIYYSQTGQTKRALEAVAAPLVAAGHMVTWRRIEPVEPYPFPWPQGRFWGVAPLCKRATGCAIQPVDLPPADEVDAILLGAQPWFLAPAPPVMGFLNSAAAEILRDRPVFPVMTCRAAWRQAYRILALAIHTHGGRITSRLILKDRAPTPINIITTVHYLWRGTDIHETALGRIWPRFGVSRWGWRQAQHFGAALAQSGDKKT